MCPEKVELTLQVLFTVAQCIGLLIGSFSIITAGFAAAAGIRLEDEDWAVLRILIVLGRVLALLVPLGGIVLWLVWVTTC